MINQIKRIISTALLLQIAVIAYGQHIREPIQVTDMLKIKTVADVNLNSESKLVVFTVKSIVQNAENKLDYDYNTQIWIANTTGNGAPRQLTSGKESATQPVFSPDGKQIAFVRTVKGKPQLFLLRVNEGGEAIQLTDARYGANDPKWSPDGKQLLFSAQVSLHDLLKDSLLNPAKKLPLWAFEKPGFNENQNLTANTTQANPDGNLEAIRAYLEINEKDKKAKVVDKLQFQTETAISSEQRFAHIYIIDAKPGAKERPVTKGFYAFNNPRFLNSLKVVFTGNIRESRHPDRVLENRIYVANTDGSGIKELLGADSTVFQLLAVSPSGKLLAYQESVINKLSVPVLKIFNLEDSSKNRIITYDRNNSDVKFSKDEKQVYFTSSSNGGYTLNSASLSTGKVTTLSSVDVGITDYDVNGGVVAFAKTEVSNPSELYVSDSRLGKQRLLSDFNASWLAYKNISLPEKSRFTNEKGLEVEYWVMKPINFEKDRKYSLITEIHGGPASMFGPGDVSMWLEYQYFCARGYGVMYSNPRGSSGYGEQFLRANINDWGTGPASDVITALDKTVAQGWADTSKLFITGGSYAGYLTCWIISHDQRFKAASSQRGVYDLGTFFGEGNVWRMVPRYFGGYPWEEKTKAILERESPINYVQSIHTPYLIFHGDDDHRTGVTQSERLYKSLKVLGKSVEYVRQPGASHELTRSGDNRQRIDQLLRTYEFFERFNK